MSEGERWVDVVREGVDCVLRYGNLPDSDMVGRRLIVLDRLTCAAPAYLARHGTPAGIDALEGHRMIGLRSLSTGNLWPLEFMVDGALRTIDMPATVSVTGTESYLAAARLGLGLFQVPRFHAGTDLAEGRLVPLLVETPPPSVPVSILWPRNRQLSPRVRAFVDWAVEQFARAQL
jgi:DNA-binding transcriptional LysR family regulator